MGLPFGYQATLPVSLPPSHKRDLHPRRDILWATAVPVVCILVLSLEISPVISPVTQDNRLHTSYLV